MIRMTDYASMARELNKLIDIARKIKTELSSMQKYAGNLDVFWDGEANAEFILNVNTGIHSANLLLEKIKRFGTFLSYALSRYQASEKEISDLIGGIMQ